MKYDIFVEKFKLGISTINRYVPITKLRTLLSLKQLYDYINSCFGNLKNMTHCNIWNQLSHNLLLRQLKQSNPNKLWIGVDGINSNLA